MNNEQITIEQIVELEPEIKVLFDYISQLNDWAHLSMLTFQHLYTASKPIFGRYVGSGARLPELRTDNAWNTVSSYFQFDLTKKFNK